MIEQYQLSNGIRVVLDSIPHVHSVAIGVWIKAGSADETVKNNGMAHMVEHMVFKGTKNRTAAQIADFTAHIGGNVNAYTSKEFTSYYAWVLRENLGKAIELLGDMLFHSLFREEDLIKEKGIVMEEIDMYKDSPEDVVHEMLQKQIWEDHPLGFLISGEKEVVETFTGNELKKFIQEHYTGENMIISIAGSFSRQEIKGQLEEAFGCFPARGKEKSKELPVFHPCIYIEEKDIEQIHLNIAYDSITSTARERYAFSILNSILGGGVNSRLFLKIREEMGITYSICSYGSTFMEAGLFHLYAGLNANQLEPAVEAMGRELLLLKKESFTGEELLRAKEQIKTDLIIQGESTRGHMSSNARELMLFNRIISLEDTLHAVNQVTKEEIMDCLYRYFSSRRMSAAIAGNLEEMPDSMRKLETICQYFESY